MLDFGWQEFVVIGLVLVLVVGPKDMPRMMRAIAKYIGKARGMARDFQASMMEAANQEEFNSVKKALNDVKSGGFAEAKQIIENSVEDAGLKEGIGEIKGAAADIKTENNMMLAPTKKAAPKTKAAKKKAKTAGKTTAPKKKTKKKSTA